MTKDNEIDWTKMKVVETLKLTQSESEAFAKALLEPPRECERLKKLMQGKTVLDD